MSIKSGSKAGFNTEKIKDIIGKVVLRVYADTNNEGDTPDTEGDNEGNKSQPSVNYEDLISKARKEEKAKQYKNIERLKTQVNTLTAQHNSDLLVVADLENKLEEANNKLLTAGSGDSEEITVLKNTIKSLEGEKADLDKQVKDYENNKPQSREEIEKEVRAELEKEYEVKTYKAQKLAELKDQLLVPELVGGDTKEDIDTSIEVALSRSEEIRKSLGIEGGEKKRPKKVPNSPSNPSSRGGGSKEVSFERLANMDVRSKEYAELRQQLGLH